MNNLLRNEDWLATFTGFLIIALALFGHVPFVPSFAWKDGEGLLARWSDLGNWLSIDIFLVLTVLIGLSTQAGLGKKNWTIWKGLAFLFFLTLVSQWIAGYKPIKDLGIEYVIFALLLGIAVRNVIGLPAWLPQPLPTEFFIKNGLVVLGTSIIFQDIVKAGALGLVQALVVVVAVWYFAFWVAKWLKIDQEMSLMLSSAVSICGVSAAIATAGAIQGDSKKLSYVVSLVLIVALPMMLFMPYVAKELGLSAEVAGAWLGGTIDTTGAVVASGTLLGEQALKYSTIVKFSQNVLLGFAAIAISVYWTFQHKKGEQKNAVGLGTIWERFPKFVLGFLAASLLCSFIVPKETLAQGKDFLKAAQTTFFALAFVCTGLETDFSMLMKTGNGRPALAFVVAQVFNILLTLGVAYVLFG